MAFDTLILKNSNSGETKRAPVGFSWTTFFFTLFVPLLRADWKFALIMLLVGMVSVGISWLVFPFIYNKLYIKDLIYNRGFKVTGSEKGDLKLIADKLEMELPLVAG